MKLKLQLSEDHIEKIMVKECKRRIEMIKQDMESANPAWLNLNKADWKAQIRALEIVYDYYGGNVK
jgi:hypothetical protein